MLLLTALAPAAWGTTYAVTAEWLPPDRPMFSAAMRSLPVGLALLLWTRQLPRGEWWWKAAVLGLLNIGLFFPLIFLSAYGLPGGVASTVQALSPLAVMGVAWIVLRERAGVRRVAAGVIGLVGVALLVATSSGVITMLGLVGAIGSVLVSAVGFVLIKRWQPPVDMFTLVSWQLVAAGIFLTPAAWWLEGPPPTLDAPAVAGYLWIGIVGTALAYRFWFAGLQALPAGAVALVGLLNPVVGTALGVIVTGELFGWFQAVGVVLIFASVVLGQSRSGTVSGRPDPGDPSPAGGVPESIDPPAPTTRRATRFDPPALRESHRETPATTA